MSICFQIGQIDLPVVYRTDNQRHNNPTNKRCQRRRLVVPDPDQSIQPVFQIEKKDKHTSGRLESYKA